MTVSIVGVAFMLGQHLCLDDDVALNCPKLETRRQVLFIIKSGLGFTICSYVFLKAKDLQRMVTNCIPAQNSKLQ
jgi:hypothetical protein